MGPIIYCYYCRCWHPCTVHGSTTEGRGVPVSTGKSPEVNDLRGVEC